MTPRIRIVVSAITFVCLLLIARQVRRREMRAIYLLSWTVLTVVTIPLIAFPSSLDTISGWLGIYYPPATIFLMAIIVLFLISVHFSRQVTRLDERTRILAEELALLQVDSQSPPTTPLDSALRAPEHSVSMTSVHRFPSGPVASNAGHREIERNRNDEVVQIGRGDITNTRGPEHHEG